jgi:antitoxin component of MazEF toxin-antitoxin module
MLRLKVRRIGNSNGMLVPKAVLEQLDLQEGSVVVAEVRGRELVIRAPKETRKQRVASAREDVHHRHRAAFEKLAK